MADLERYFLVSHNGRVIPACTIGIVDESEWPQEIFSCRVCFAITAEPMSHAEWHEEQDERKSGG